MSALIFLQLVNLGLSGVSLGEGITSLILTKDIDDLLKEDPEIKKKHDQLKDLDTDIINQNRLININKDESIELSKDILSVNKSIYYFSNRSKELIDNISRSSDIEKYIRDNEVLNWESNEYHKSLLNDRDVINDLNKVEKELSKALLEYEKNEEGSQSNKTSNVAAIILLSVSVVLLGVQGLLVYYGYKKAKAKEDANEKPKDDEVGTKELELARVEINEKADSLMELNSDGIEIKRQDFAIDSDSDSDSDSIKVINFDSEQLGKEIESGQNELTVSPKEINSTRTTEADKRANAKTVATTAFSVFSAVVAVAGIVISAIEIADAIKAIKKIKDAKKQLNDKFDKLILEAQTAKKVLVNLDTGISNVEMYSNQRIAWSDLKDTDRELIGLVCDTCVKSIKKHVKQNEDSINNSTDKRTIELLKEQNESFQHNISIYNKISMKDGADNESVQSARYELMRGYTKEREELEDLSTKQLSVLIKLSDITEMLGSKGIFEDRTILDKPSVLTYKQDLAERINELRTSKEKLDKKEEVVSKIYGDVVNDSTSPQKNGISTLLISLIRWYADQKQVDNIIKKWSRVKQFDAVIKNINMQWEKRAGFGLSSPYNHIDRFGPFKVDIPDKIKSLYDQDNEELNDELNKLDSLNSEDKIHLKQKISERLNDKNLSASVSFILDKITKYEAQNISITGDSNYQDKIRVYYDSDKIDKIQSLIPVSDDKPYLNSKQIKSELDDKLFSYIEDRLASQYIEKHSNENAATLLEVLQQKYKKRNHFYSEADINEFLGVDPDTKLN